MIPQRAKQAIRAFASPSHRAVQNESRAELHQVNTRAGTELIRPEFSGLSVRRAVTPSGGRVLMIDLRYRWMPSMEQRRRKVEMRHVNRARRLDRTDHLLPPLLTYTDDTSMPTRVRPRELGRHNSDLSVGERIFSNRTDLEELAKLHRVLVIQPRPPKIEDEQLLNTWSRPIFPHHGGLRSLFGRTRRKIVSQRSIQEGT